MGDKEGKPEPGDKGRRSGPDNLQREKSNHLSVKGDFAAAALAISATFINRPFGTAASPCHLWRRATLSDSDRTDKGVGGGACQTY